MPVRAQLRRFAVIPMLTALFGCKEPTTTVEPRSQTPVRTVPVLSEDDEALLASLLADDPGDFHVARARIWRIGPARWIVDGPELPSRPNEDLRTSALDQPVEVVIVDPEGPRVLLPLGDLDRGARAPSWSALRLVAVLSPGDLVAGLTRELQPTPWLTLSAGVALTPLGRENDHLRVQWSDPACGFALDLAIDSSDFGPLYEPGPAGRPGDEPEPVEGRSPKGRSPKSTSLRLAPGTRIFADPEGREPILTLDREAPSESEWLSAAQRITLTGAPVRKLQPINLRCRGVIIDGYVATADIVEIPGRYAIVEAAPPPSSTCAAFEADAILVPRATALYEPTTGDPALVGVVASDIELRASPGADGWWRSCVLSPWGDLIVQFRLR